MVIFHAVQAQSIRLSTTTPCSNDQEYYVEIIWNKKIKNIELDPGVVGFSANPVIEMSDGNKRAMIYLKWPASAAGKTSTLGIVFQEQVSRFLNLYRRVPEKNFTLNFRPLPSVNGRIIPPAESILREGIAYQFRTSSLSPGISSYHWYINNILQPVTGPQVNLTFPAHGSYTVACKTVNSCGQESLAAMTTVANVYCIPTDFSVTGDDYICPGGSVEIQTHSQQTATSYAWTKDGSSIPGGASILATSAGTYKVTAAFPDGCVGVITHVVQASMPPSSPITQIKGQGLGFTGEPMLLEAVGGGDALEFDWKVKSGGSGTFVNASGGTVLNQRVLFTPSAASSAYVVEVTAVRNQCKGIPFERTAIEVLSQATRQADSVVLHHAELTAGTAGYLYLPHREPDYGKCFEQPGPVTVNVSLDLGQYYNLGKNTFNSKLTVNISPYYDIPAQGPGTTWSIPLEINQDAPEQLFSRSITVDPHLLRFIKIQVSGYTAPVIAAANLIRLKATYEEHNVINVSDVLVTPVHAVQTGGDKKWEQTFNWTSSCADVPDYIFQILKQDGTKTPNINDPATWKDALLIHTESNAMSLTLSLGEGSGKYYWRVVPLGNREGGIVTSSNWGAPSAVDILDYVHPETDKNWIYSRTFTEGNKVGEKITYANGLQQTAQQVTRLQDENKLIAQQTVQDYVGRDAVSSLPIPVANRSSLLYVNNLLTNVTTGLPYQASDFDGQEHPLAAKDLLGYYGGSYVSAAENDRVASADGYPFSQNIFKADGTNRIRERAGVGLVHSKKGGRTNRIFYTRPLEGELVSLFGSEAPQANSVQKITTYDANNVASIAYQTKEGKIIATALSMTGDGNIPLTELSSLPAAATFIEEIKNNQRVNDYTVVGRTPLFLPQTGGVTVNYEITPAQLQELCGGSGNSDLIGYYPFENNARDLSGRNNHGTATNATLTADALGRQSAYSLSGASNSYIQIPDGPDVDFDGEDFSISYWVKRANVTSTTWSNAPGVGKWSSFTATGNEWGLMVRSATGSNVPAFFLEAGTKTFKATATTSLQANVWYHLAGVRQGNTLKIYINGVLEGTVALDPGTRVNNVGLPLQVGRVGTFYTAGAFDDVQLYRRALSDSDVKQLLDRSTLCTTCDYSLNFRFLREGVPVTGVSLPSRIIRAGACAEQVSRKFTATPFTLTLDGGVNYTLEKYLTLNNTTKSNTALTYVDSASLKVEAFYRDQATTRLAQVRQYIASGDYAGLYTYLGTAATHDTENKQYVLPLLAPGTGGCQQFIYIPEVAICPPTDVLDEGTCKMNGLSFEQYFEHYYEGRQELNLLGTAGNTSADLVLRYNPGDVLLNYMYFTNQYPTAPVKDQRFKRGELDAMINNLIDANELQLANSTTESACARVWRIWKTEVMAYETNMKLDVSPDGQQQLPDLGTAIPEKFSLFQSFMTALDADLQSILTETDQEICTGSGRPLFIGRTTLYGKIMCSETANALAPDRTQAHALVYYNSDVKGMVDLLRFYANISVMTPVPCDPNQGEPEQSDFDALDACTKYKVARSTNLGDQGVSTTTPAQAEALAQANIQQMRNQCGKACDGRREEFRQAIIQSLMEQNAATIIEHYSVYLDNTYHTSLWTGVLDSTRNNTGFTVSQCSLEAAVSALVANCKNNYCNVTLTPHDEPIKPGSTTMVRVYGTEAELLKLEQAISYNFELEVSQANQSCQAGWDRVMPTGGSGGSGGPARNVILNQALAEQCTFTPQSFLNSNCFEGWSNASGDASLGVASRNVFMWSSLNDGASEAVRGTFSEPLVPGQSYTVTVDCKIERPTGYAYVVNDFYIEVSPSPSYKKFDGSTSTLSGAASRRASATAPDDSVAIPVDSLNTGGAAFRSAAALRAPYTRPGATTPSEVLINGASEHEILALTNLTNLDQFQTATVTFTATAADQYFFVTIRANSSTPQGITFHNLRISTDSTSNPQCARLPICFHFTESSAQPVEIPVGMEDHVYNPELVTCKDALAGNLLSAIDQQVEQLINARVAGYREQYYNTCSDPAMIDDKLTITKTEGRYQYTLYYYDRAGNLARTVPPEGVSVQDVSTPTRLATVKATSVTHTMVTEYQYNTLGQVIREHSPDGNLAGEYIDTNGDNVLEFVTLAGFTKPTDLTDAALNASKYYNTLVYNDKGLLRFSRNAKQKLEGTYSYTKYDALGRILEVGEGSIYNEVVLMNSRNEIGTSSYPQTNNRFVTRTIYTDSYADGQYPALPQGYVQQQNNLRNRISFTYLDKDGLDGTIPEDRTYTIYDYDVHGNIDWLVQILPGLPGVGMRYEYDLLSGKVTQVHYSPGNADAFHHRYAYDANNRLQTVQTSRDAHVWETDARYSYYLHGPIKRLTLGDDLLQGIDYTQTINGWLKGINHGLLNKTSDPGQDAVNTSLVGRDAFGMALGYYAGDYKFSGSPFSEGTAGNLAPLANKSLFNGNISTWTSNTFSSTGSITQYPQLTGNHYTYDRLNRILTAGMQVYNSTTSAFSAAPNANYSSSYTYLGNGNIRRSINYRGNEAGINRLMDDMLYNYDETGSNRLSSVADDAAVNTFGDDIEPGQTKYNYQYDAIGNLIRDVQQGTAIQWNVYGKVERVQRTQGGNQYITDFGYSSAGDRVVKRQTNPSGLVSTDYYVRDAGGNIMAVYEKTEQNGQPVEILLNELPIYGGDRLGIYTKSVSIGTGQVINQTPLEPGEVRIAQNVTKNQYESVSYLVNPEVELNLGAGFSYTSSGTGNQFRARVGAAPEASEDVDDVYVRSLNSRRYELKDHLGNIRAAVTDVKLAMLTSNAPGDYRPEVVSVYNYYAFGMEMPGRTWEAGTKYRYGFNGKEKDNNGEWGTTQYDYGFRIYNPGIGKFLSVDPLKKDYPWNSTYAFAENDVIRSIDLDGLEKLIIAKSFSGQFMVLQKLTDIDPSLKPMLIGDINKKELENKIHIYVGATGTWNDGETIKNGLLTDAARYVDFFDKNPGHPQFSKKDYDVNKDLITSLGTTPQEILEKEKAGIKQLGISIDRKVDGLNQIKSYAHEVELHVKDELAGDKTTMEQEHRSGNGDQYYDDGHDVGLSPPHDDIDPNTRMGKIFKQIDKALEKGTTKTK